MKTKRQITLTDHRLQGTAAIAMRPKNKAEVANISLRKRSAHFIFLSDHPVHRLGEQNKRQEKTADWGGF